MSVKHIKTSKEFNKTIEENANVIIDFSAEWCGPCKAIAPKFTAIAKKNPKIVFVKIDVDASQDIAERLEIDCMPTFILMQNGKEVKRESGADIRLVEKMVDMVDVK